MDLSEILGIAVGILALIAVISIFGYAIVNESKRLSAESKIKMQLEERKVVALEKLADAISEVYDV